MHVTVRNVCVKNYRVWEHPTRYPNTWLMMSNINIQAQRELICFAYNNYCKPGIKWCVN